jgi:hypothetical protein
LTLVSEIQEEESAKFLLSSADRVTTAKGEKSCIPKFWPCTSTTEPSRTVDEAAWFTLAIRGILYENMLECDAAVSPEVKTYFK